MRLACVEIREAYLFKESTETMQIEGWAGEGQGGALYVHLVQSEGGGRRRGRGERSETKTMEEGKSQRWEKGV